VAEGRHKKEASELESRAKQLQVLATARRNPRSTATLGLWALGALWWELFRQPPFHDEGLYPRQQFINVLKYCNGSM
jgi:hypothetical protein